MIKLEPPDLTALKKAKVLLENPGLAAKITNFIGIPIEKGFEMLPVQWNAKVGEITRAALFTAIDIALFTMKQRPLHKASDFSHTMVAAASGGIGGFFGLPALAVELPVSTIIMLRSIANIAQSEGEILSDPESRSACIEVFALGGRNKSDNAADSGYFALRAMLAKSVTEAADYILQKGLFEEGAPALIRLILVVGERFGIQVSEKLAAQSIPIIGAAGGAIINTIFIEHFQQMAHGHFIVRRLEKRYGREIVEHVYRHL
jgi:hypothetical protein